MKDTKKTFKEYVRSKLKMYNIKKKILNTIFRIYRLILKKEIILRVLATYFSLFEIKYTYDTLIYYDEKNQYEDEMKIWYFEIYSLKDWTYAEKIEMFTDYIYWILKYLLKEFCKKNWLNFNTFLETKIINNYTVDFITKKVADIFSKSISSAMLSYYMYVKETFEDTFESRWWFYILKDKNYLLNEEKNKLFKEYKISQAEKYLKNAIKRYIAKIIKEKFFWIKDKNGNKLEVNYSDNDIVDENKLIQETNSWWDDITFTKDNEEDILKKDENKNSKILERIEELKKQWWLKNMLQAKIEYEIYKTKNMKFEDTKVYKKLKNKKEKLN